MIGMPRHFPALDDTHGFVTPSDVAEAAELGVEDKIAILERWRAHVLQEMPTTSSAPTLAEIDALLERLAAQR